MCKVTMCFLQGRSKSCKPSQATAVLGAGFGVFSHLLLQSHQGCAATVQGLSCVQLPQHHRCDGLGLHRYLSFPSPKGAAAELEVLTGGQCASMLGG